MITDATGKASFTATVPIAINPGLAVTATATNINTGDTSEFSAATADLALSKGADPTVGTAGQALTYTLTVTNDGPFQATGVIATDAVPAGAVFVAASASQGTASPVGGVVVALLGGLAAGDSATVTIVVSPSAAGSLTNTAVVTASEPDPDPSNNSATVTTTINAAPPPPAVDLAVTKSAPASGVAGQDLAYRIVVTNAGPGNESAARLADQLPPGVILVSTSEPPTTAAAGLLVFDLGDLPAHASRTVVLLIRPMAAGTLVNQAVVSGIQTDLDPSNNLASATTTVAAAPAALVVALVAAPSTATIGHELIYTLTVANFGPGPASGVVLTTDIPAGATIVAASQTQGVSSIGSGIVTTALGGLAFGASATVTIVVIPTAAGMLTAVAGVAGNEPNPDPAFAVATVSTPVARCAADPDGRPSRDQDGLAQSGDRRRAADLHHYGHQPRPRRRTGRRGLAGRPPAARRRLRLVEPGPDVGDAERPDLRPGRAGGGRLGIGDGRGRADGPRPAVQPGGRHGRRPRP